MQAECSQFKQVGVDMVRLKIKDNALDKSSVTTFPTPFFDEELRVSFGCSVLPMYSGAGIPNGDGYIYVYGLGSDNGRKTMLISRVLPKDFEQFDRYTFYDGIG